MSKYSYETCKSREEHMKIIISQLSIIIIIISMSLNRFEQCNTNHKSKLEYVCLKSNKVFCTQCWRTKGHMYQCHSTRCGNLEKLAHLTIDKTLEMKSLHYISEMSSSYEKSQKLNLNFLQFKQYITQTIKEDINNKLPLFLSSFLNEMLGTKSSKASSLIYEEATCSEMLKLIKNKDEERYQSLQATINGFQKISHMHSALQRKLKEKSEASDQSCKTAQILQQDDRKLEQVLKFYHEEAFNLINNIKLKMKNLIQNQIKDSLSKFDPSIEFEGVKFNKKPDFSAFQNYRPRSLVLENYPQFEGPSQSIYIGGNIDIPVIQQCPELLLETSKNFLKNRLYDLYNEIKDFKSPFPYKFANIIATTVAPDREYELAMIDLEKMFVKKVNKIEKPTESSFMNSVNLVIMGPELIIIEFKNRPRNTAIVSIYNHKDERVKFYDEVLEKIGFKKSNQMKKIQKIYKFETELTPVGLVYAELQIAYEYLFMDSDKISEFEGQKYAQGRGSSLFQEISQKYKNSAIVDFEIPRNINQICKLIV